MAHIPKVVEVWTPDADGSLLELRDGWFGGAEAYAALARRMCFGRGEGLPGRAWDDGVPLLLTRLDGGYFRRSAAAKLAGLGAAAALPVFVGGALTCVVLLYFEDAQALSLGAGGPGIPCTAADGTLHVLHYDGPSVDGSPDTVAAGVALVEPGRLLMPVVHDGRVAKALALAL